jgi:hypothetical protein
MQENLSKREELLKKFIEPFYAQKDKIDGIESSKDLAKKSDINPSKLSTAFSYAKKWSETKKYDVEKEKVCDEIFRKLDKKWEIIDGIFIESEKETVKLKSNEKVFPSFPTKDFLETLEKCKEGDEIAILDTYYDTLLHEDNVELRFANWIDNKNIKLKILVLPPEGKAISLRYHDGMSVTYHEFADKCLKCLKLLLQLQIKYPNNVDVKVIDAMPGVNLYRLPNIAYYGVFLTTDISNNTTFTKVSPASHYAYAQMNEHFENLWAFQNAIPLDKKLLDKSQNVINQRKSENRIKGIWNIFLHDNRFPYTGNNEKFGYISRFRLTISEMKKNGKIPIELEYTFRGENDIIATNKLPHNALYERLDDANFYHFLFTDHKTFSFYLYVKDNSKITDPKPMLSASYTMIYEAEITGGRALLKRGNENPISEAPLIGEQNTFDDDILRIFAAKGRNVYSTNDDWYQKRSKEKNLNHLEGTYEIFMYGRNSRKQGEKGIEHNVLKITKFGYVEYKYPTGRRATGVAYLLGKNLYITLFDAEEDNRVFYFVLHVNPKPERNENLIFLGVSLGLASQEYPTGRRIIAKWTAKKFDRIDSERIENHSEQYQQLPTEFRTLLSGRLNNIVGFLHEPTNLFNVHNLKKEVNHQKAIATSDLFKNAALYHLIQGDLKETLKNLTAATNHGFNNFGELEKEIISANISFLPFSTELFADKAYQEMKNKQMLPLDWNI